LADLEGLVDGGMNNEDAMSSHRGSYHRRQQNHQRSRSSRHLLREIDYSNVIAAADQESRYDDLPLRLPRHRREDESKKGQGIFKETQINPVLEALIEGTGERKPSHRSHVIEKPFMANTISLLPLTERATRNPFLSYHQLL
jgi:hypothetical protein